MKQGPNVQFPRRGFFLFSLQFWISAAIIGFFAAMMFLLWRRERALRVAVRELGISPDLLTVTWVDYDQFMWIERGGQRIGIYALLVRRAPDHKSYELTSQVRLNMAVFNQQLPIRMDIAVKMNELFEMQIFQGELTAAGQEITAYAFADGLNLYYDLKGPEFFVTGGGLTAKTTLDKPVLLADAIRPIVTQNDKLKVGNKWSALASDPISGRFNVPVNVEVAAKEELEFGGKKVEAFRVVEIAGELQTTTWYESDGRPIKADLGNGLTMIRADRQRMEDMFPELKNPVTFKEIDRDAVRSKAVEKSAEENQNLMPWLPKI